MNHYRQLLYTSYSFIDCSIRIQDPPENDRIKVEPRLSDSRREDRILDPEDAAVLDQLEKDIYLGVIRYSWVGR